MSDGTRSRTGCLTCRIRKKKCGEQRPICQACHARQLPCYGYDAPLPDWYTSKSNWNEVKNCDEAKELRTQAESRYRVQRRARASERVSNPVSTSGDDPGEGSSRREEQLSDVEDTLVTAVASLPTPSSVVPAANTWQLRPGTVWWDDRMSALATNLTASTHQETRLLIMYIEVIHPIIHGFYPLSTSRDRNWFTNRLVSDEALYNAALSVSACFEHSLTQPPMINNIGISSLVRSLQGKAIRDLQSRIDSFATTEPASIEDLVCTGVALVDVMLNLINLEIFSMLQGSWELHFRAIRPLLNNMENRARARLERESTELPVPFSAVGYILAGLPDDDERRRSLKYCLTNFVWIDIIGTATFGLMSYAHCVSDYLGLIDTEVIKPQQVMGCQGWIMAVIVRTARLERWWARQTSQTERASELIRRANLLADQLASGINRLEAEVQPSTGTTSSIQEDIRLVSILWAYGAQIFLRVILLGDAEDSRSSLPPLTTLVDTFLRKIEELPSRLVMRVHWPYTIAGCMTLDESLHDRFRQILAKTMQESHPPGVTWKGLIVMEECWKMRRNMREDGASEAELLKVGWREAMQSMDARVLLV